MKPDIWMPLYISDFLRDTIQLSAAETGAYLLLLMAEWVSGPLPDDDEILARIAHCNSVAWLSLKPSLIRYYMIAEGRWSQQRLQKERARAINLRTRASAGARATNEKRWGPKASEEVAKPSLNLSPCDSLVGRTSPSPSHKDIDIKAAQSNARRLPDDFKPNSQHEEMAKGFGLNLADQVTRFCDHWKAESGAKARKKDWDAALRTWLRNAHDWGVKNGTIHPVKKFTPGDPSKPEDWLKAQFEVTQ